MTEKVAHKETDVILIHKISVDMCIADEIEKLNNVYDIFTLSSCCGHGEIGYIIVAGSDIQQMSKLGYNTIALKYIDNDIVCNDDRMVLCGLPKSKCICNKGEIWTKMK